MTRNTSKLTRSAAEGPGADINRLAPTVETISAQPHTPRAARRHGRTNTGAVVNIPRVRQAPGLNVPYRKPA